ncbi:MAG: hypothetical protein S4CHLAM45_02180 [Chlamydiales bacterium]|nr:hypothetical protein [Chlamydiales bacterium]MCH9620354.1 hypothetical protein [Chlamydiales bacterium]MCH9622340.1 hypothetical protein [Chlamydiales bacterium]
MEETLELIPIQFDKMLQSSSYTCVVLGNDEKKFAIYTAPITGKAMQSYLTKTEKPRPLTHDLIKQLFNGLEIKVKQVVINDLQDTVYFARLFLEQKIHDILHIVEVDARPSDCITMALIYRVPIFCTRNVFEKAIDYAE